MMMPSTAAAAIAIPAIAPPDSPELGVCDSVGDGDDGLVFVLPLVGEDVVLDGVAVDEPVLAAVVVNRDRSSCWKATVMGCPHIVTGPERVVKMDEVSERYEVKPGNSANTVVTPASREYMLVQP